MTDKVICLDQALDMVPDGCTLTAGGFAHSHQPMGFIRALIAQGRSDIALVGVAECWVAEWLAAANILKRTWFSNFMLEGFGRCRRFSEAVESGALAVEDHSHFGILMRLAAAGQRLPFMPLLSQAGTDIVRWGGLAPADQKTAMVTSPFADKRVVSVTSPLSPDVAVIHAARADHNGNIQLFGAASAIDEQAAASRVVIVTVEEIVSGETFARNPGATLLPGLAVDAVVHLPYGAWPTGVYGYYDPDLDFLQDYYQASREASTCDAWVESNLKGPTDHWDWLDRAGVARLLALRCDPVLGYRPREAVQ